MSRKPNITGCCTEQERMLKAYREALSAMNQIIRPKDVEDILVKLSKEPNVRDIFPVQSHPLLNNLWYTARTARERYMAALAEEVVNHLPERRSAPKIESEGGLNEDGEDEAREADEADEADEPERAVGA